MITPTALVNPRIELARTRRMLEDTAISAAAGTLVALGPDHGSAHRWTAEVRRPSGEHVTLHLDRQLQTVELAPAGAISRAA